MYLLAMCHECVVEQSEGVDENFKVSQKVEYHKNLRYQGPSPDEVTLVDIARHYGYVFLGATTS